MLLRDKYGFAVERIKERYIINFLRLLLHTSIWKTWKHRKRTTGQPWDIQPDPNVQMEMK